MLARILEGEMKKEGNEENNSLIQTKKQENEK